MQLLGKFKPTCKASKSLRPLVKIVLSHTHLKGDEFQSILVFGMSSFCFNDGMHSRLHGLLKFAENLNKQFICDKVAFPSLRDLNLMY